MSLLERKRGTGGKFKKNSKRTLQLSNEDLEYLKKNTALEEKDIREWFRYFGNLIFTPFLKFFIPSGFIEDNPDGLMRRDKLLGMYINVLSNAKAKQFVNQIFSKYDTDNSGSIDFKVYLC